MKTAALKSVEPVVEATPIAIVTKAKLQLVPKLKCSANESRCANIVRFAIDEEYFCQKHFDQFWEDHYVEDHDVRRVGSVNYDDF